MSRINLVPWIFLAPAVVVFGIYVVIPVFQSFWLSLYDWDGLSPNKKFIGLSNYAALLQDEQFWTSLKNNVYWLVLFLLGPVIGLAIAIFLNQKVRAMRIVKSLFFFPFVLSGVVIGLVFSWFYEPSHGLLNTILGIFGFPSISPLSDEHLVTPSIIAAGLWPQIAYPGVVGQQTGGAQHQIVADFAGKARRLRSADFERQARSRLGDEVVADIGKGDQAVEQVITVGAPPGDVKVEVDLGRGKGRNRHRGLSRRRRARVTSRPRSSLASIGLISSASGRTAGRAAIESAPRSGDRSASRRRRDGR